MASVDDDAQHAKALLRGGGKGRPASMEPSPSGPSAKQTSPAAASAAAAAESGVRHASPRDAASAAASKAPLSRRERSTYTLVRCVAHADASDVFLAQEDSTGEEVCIDVVELEDVRDCAAFAEAASRASIIVAR